MPLDEQGLPPVDPQTQQIGNLPVFMAGDANRHLPLLHEGLTKATLQASTRWPVRHASSGAVRRWPLFFRPAGGCRGPRRWADLTPTPPSPVAPVFMTRACAHCPAQRGAALHLRRPGHGPPAGADVHPAGRAHGTSSGAGGSAKTHGARPAGNAFYHPTYEEGLRTALRDAARQLPQPADSDLATCGGIGVPALE